MWPFKKKIERNKAVATHESKPETVVTPPVDLNKPLENPDLKAAILRLGEAQTADNKKALWSQLNQANYLVIINPDELKIKTKPSSIEGQGTIESGSVLKVLTCRASDGKHLLPAFTDWNEVSAFAGTQDVATLVMSPQRLWEFVLDSSFEGAVINPAGKSLPLTCEQLQGLRAQIQCPACGQMNDSTNQFCGKCGKPLTTT